MKKILTPLPLAATTLAALPAAAASTYAQTKYPIVLSHGLFGFNGRRQGTIRPGRFRSGMSGSAGCLVRCLALAPAIFVTLAASAPFSCRGAAARMPPCPT